jgi:hypothetical protein
MSEYFGLRKRNKGTERCCFVRSEPETTAKVENKEVTKPWNIQGATITLAVITISDYVLKTGLPIKAMLLL